MRYRSVYDVNLKRATRRLEIQRGGSNAGELAFSFMVPAPLEEVRGLTVRVGRTRVKAALKKRGERSEICFMVPGAAVKRAIHLSFESPVIELSSGSGERTCCDFIVLDVRIDRSVCEVVLPKGWEFRRNVPRGARDGGRWLFEQGATRPCEHQLYTFAAQPAKKAR
jgi:hypothetical protein